MEFSFKVTRFWLFAYLATVAPVVAQTDPRAILNGILESGSIIQRLNQSEAFKQVPPISERPSFDCSNVTNSVARILCSAREGAAADWDLNAALWARSASNDEAQEKLFQQEQQAWRNSVPRTCVLENNSTAYSPQQFQCVVGEFHRRATAVRSMLPADGIAESQMAPESRFRIQAALVVRGYLQTMPDGEFGPLTRMAIKQYQASVGRPATGYLTETDRLLFLGKSQREIFYAPPGGLQNGQRVEPLAPPSNRISDASESARQITRQQPTPTATPLASQNNIANPKPTIETPPATTRTDAATPKAKIEKVNDVFWFGYFFGLAVILFRFAQYWRIARHVRTSSTFDLSGQEMETLIANRNNLQSAVMRREAIASEGANLKQNLDGTYHRGSKLGQKLNDELEELRPRIQELLLTVAELGRLPNQRLYKWASARASIAAMPLALAIYVYAPLTLRSFMLPHLAMTAVASAVSFFLARLAIRPVVVTKMQGISEFREKWAEYDELDETDDEITFEQNDENLDGADSDYTNDDEQDSLASDSKAVRAWHEILCVPQNASMSEIKSARNKKVKEFHSDRLKSIDGLSPEFTKFADQKMAEVNEAYDQAVAERRA